MHLVQLSTVSIEVTHGFASADAQKQMAVDVQEGIVGLELLDNQL